MKKCTHLWCHCRYWCQWDNQQLFVTNRRGFRKSNRSELRTDKGSFVDPELNTSGDANISLDHVLQRPCCTRTAFTRWRLATHTSISIPLHSSLVGFLLLSKNFPVFFVVRVTTKSPSWAQSLNGLDHRPHNMYWGKFWLHAVRMRWMSSSKFTHAETKENPMFACAWQKFYSHENYVHGGLEKNLGFVFRGDSCWQKERTWMLFFRLFSDDVQTCTSCTHPESMVFPFHPFH